MGMKGVKENMKERMYVIVGEVEKCYGCNGRGYTESENHPECPMCSGAEYVKKDKDGEV
ncbi:hypothetical protein [Paenibacillus medicaginis]|uniref:Rubredoxin-like domain-containing protein n=1 Tax=Paenibacillus medicaginis TaxID=1470560 RepID=A0ABV5BY06_9BACL